MVAQVRFNRSAVEYRPSAEKLAAFFCCEPAGATVVYFSLSLIGKSENGL
jgi:hypothetical protein